MTENKPRTALEIATDLHVRRTELGNQINRLQRQIREVENEIAAAHLASLVAGEELPKALFRNIKVKANGQWGWLTESTRYNTEPDEDERWPDFLYDADPDCIHQIASLSSGVACTMCRGWYCA